MSNIFELFETFLSYCTNSLSFVRVGAFALSHASMMGVVFSLAGTVPAAAFGSGNLVVIVIGNLFVMALEGLIVGIQVLNCSADFTEETAFRIRRLNFAVI